MNLVDLLAGQLDAGTRAGLARRLGESQDRTDSVLYAVVSTVVAGLAGGVSTAEGAEYVDAWVGQADDHALAGFSAAVAEGERWGLEPEQIAPLFGGGEAVGKLCGVLAKYTGLDEAKIARGLGLAVPLVLSLLKKQKQSQGLDASGVARLLASQKDYLAGGMPDLLGKMLGSSPGLGTVGATAHELFGVIPEEPAEQPRTAPRRRPETAKPSGVKLVLAIVAILLLVWVVWRIMARRQGAGPVGGAGVEVVVASVQDGFRSTVNGISWELERVGDREAAEAAVPDLRAIAEELDRLNHSFGGLPADARAEVAMTVRARLEKLEPVVEKALSDDGVREVLGPVIEPMLAVLRRVAGG